MEQIKNNKGVIINPQKKREKIRRKLRDYGVLPNVNETPNEEQKKILDEISKNDFSFYEQYKLIKHRETKTYKTKIYNEFERPIKKKNNIINELKISGILPELDDLYNDVHKDIIMFVNENYHLSIKTLLSKYKNLMNPEYYIWYRTKVSVYKNKCRRHTDEYFNISIDDIIIPEYCPYLNIKLTTDVNNCFLPNYTTIDRIDSKKGYIKGNIQIISKLANTMKSNATKEELIIFAKNILKLNNSEFI
jgi:hypothetical protein